MLLFGRQCMYEELLARRAWSTWVVFSSTGDDVSTVVDNGLVILQFVLTDCHAVHDVSVCTRCLSQVLILAQCFGIRLFLHHASHNNNNTESYVLGKHKL